MWYEHKRKILNMFTYKTEEVNRCTIIKKTVVLLLTYFIYFQISASTIITVLNSELVKWSAMPTKEDIADRTLSLSDTQETVYYTGHIWRFWIC